MSYGDAHLVWIGDDCDREVGTPRGYSVTLRCSCGAEYDGVTGERLNPPS